MPSLHPLHHFYSFSVIAMPMPFTMTSETNIWFHRQQMDSDTLTELIGPGFIRHTYWSFKTGTVWDFRGIRTSLNIFYFLGRLLSLRKGYTQLHWQGEERLEWYSVDNLQIPKQLRRSIEVRYVINHKNQILLLSDLIISKNHGDEKSPSYHR